MTFKKVGIVLLLMISMFGAHETYAQTTNANIKKIIGENTPNFLAKPIISIVNTVEKFRSDMGIAVDIKKDGAKKEINIFNDTKTLPQNTTTVNNIQKSFEYIKLFFFTILSFIFHNPLTFYIISLLLIFLILRFLGRLFFF